MSWAQPLVKLRRVSIHPQLLATCGAVLGEPSIPALLGFWECSALLLPLAPSQGFVLALPWGMSLLSP